MKHIPNDLDRRPIQSRNTWWAKALTSAFVKAGISPNQVSSLSVIFALIGAALYYLAGNAPNPLQIACFLGAAACIQLRLLCNMFDGMIAVEAGVQSKLGALFNEIPDRIADTLFLVLAGYACNHGSLGIELGWAAALLSIYTAYIRAFGASQGLNQDFCGPMAKPHRMFVLTLASIAAAVEAGLHWIPMAMLSGLVIIVTGTAITCLRRTWRVAKALASRPQ